jgi:integrase
LKAGKDAPDIVFPSADGTLLDEANVRHMFYRILEKAGIRRVRFHDLRHTFALLLIQQGESVVYVKEQLGHPSIRLRSTFTGTWCLAEIAPQSTVSMMSRNHLQPPRNQKSFRRGRVRR